MKHQGAFATSGTRAGPHQAFIDVQFAVGPARRHAAVGTLAFLGATILVRRHVRPSSPFTRYLVSSTPRKRASSAASSRTDERELAAVGTGEES